MYSKSELLKDAHPPVNQLLSVANESACISMIHAIVVWAYNGEANDSASVGGMLNVGARCSQSREPVLEVAMRRCRHFSSLPLMDALPVSMSRFPV